MIKKGWANPAEKKLILKQWQEGSYGGTGNDLEEAMGTLEFTSALYDAAHIAAMEGYNAIDQTWRYVAKVVPRTDFKTNYAVACNGMGLLEKRTEHQPATETKPTDRKESYAIFPYERIFGLSMEARANDATGVLMENFNSWGQAATHTLNDFVWNATTGLLGGTGATMSDSNAVFDASNHSNYATSTDLTFENLQAGIAAMRVQTDEAGTQKVAPWPKYVFVPPGKEGVAKRLTMSNNVFAQGLASTSASTLGGDLNDLKSYGLQVIVIPELTSTHWIIGSDPAIFPVVEMGFLNGKTEPTIMIQKEDSDAEFFTRARYSKCQVVFGGCVKDWRTLYKGVA